MAVDSRFWRDRSVFVTGCTGFKGGWLALWLSQLGSRVHGYSLVAPTNPSFYEAVNLRHRLESLHIADIRDILSLELAMSAALPSVVIHLAAQPLVHQSYEFPLETFSTNVMGVANVLDLTRRIESVEAVVVVTTDKCYADRNQQQPYREGDQLGGSDPYASSKACAELISAAYQRSFFEGSGVAVATARAGNVIGGGDWANNRLVPDFFRSVEQSKPLSIRHPEAIRPWQHALEPLAGYLALAEKLTAQGHEFAEEWNFGPDEAATQTVAWVADYLCQGVKGSEWTQDQGQYPHETKFLSLNSGKAKSRLQWQPRWSIETALDMTIAWHQAQWESERMDEFSLDQISVFESA